MDVINVTEYREVAKTVLCVVPILFKRINNLLLSNLLLESNTDEQKSSDLKEDQGEVFLKQSFKFICWSWRDGSVLETLVTPSVLRQVWFPVPTWKLTIFYNSCS